MLGRRLEHNNPYCKNLFIILGDGRVARPFGFALTDPGRRLSRTRIFPEVTRIGLLVVSKDG